MKPRLSIHLVNFAAEPPGESGIEVAANVRVARDDRGEPQIAPAMAAVPELIAAGATDLRVHLQSPPGVDQAAEYLAPWVEAFEAAAGA